MKRIKVKRLSKAKAKAKGITGIRPVKYMYEEKMVDGVKKRKRLTY